MEHLGEFHHLRCFTELVDVEKLVNFLKTETDVLVIVHEISKVGHRPHIHATLRFHKAVNTFRDKFRKEFPELFGNKSYSISKVRDYESNLKYCLKGIPSDYPDVLYTTLSDADVKQYYNEYWALQDSILKSKAKSKEVNMGCQNDPSCESTLVKKVKSKTWAQKLTKHIIDEYPLLCQGLCQHRSGMNVDYDLLHESLTGIILEHLGKESKNLDEFILIRLYNGQLNAIIEQTGDDVAKRNFKKDLSQKIKSKTL